VKRGVITPNTPLLLGPDIGDGSFKSASIKSIHYKVSPAANSCCCRPTAAPGVMHEDIEW
jgi:GTPase